MISAAGRIVKCAVTGVHRPTVSGSVLAETRQHTWIRLDGLLLFGFSMPWPTSELPLSEAIAGSRPSARTIAAYAQRAMARQGGSSISKA